MQNRFEATKDNWFARNPIKTLICFCLLAFLVMAFGTEKYLEFRSHRQGIVNPLEAEKRYIRLREQPPGMQLMLTFPQAYRRYTDNAFNKKYRFAVDMNGFIVPSKIYDHPDKVIVFLGGSTTECMYMDEDNRFPFLVGRLLEKETGEKINSYNSGRSGNNSLNDIDILINKIIPLHPQIVVFMEDINDLSTLLYEGTYWNKHTARSPIVTIDKPKMVGKLLKAILFPELDQAYRKLKESLATKPWDEFANDRRKKITINKARFVHEFAMNLRTLICICRVHEITPVLMTQENRITDHPDPVVAGYLSRYGANTSISYSQFKDLYDAFNETIRRVGQENHVMVIDLAREVPSNKKFIYDLVHFNDTGSQLAAGIIAARLRRIIAPN
jgi:lysophospholipase L1-like esterase